MRVLIVATKYPPQHSGGALRIHRFYGRWQLNNPALKWDALRVRPQAADAASIAGNQAVAPGPDRTFEVTYPRGLASARRFLLEIVAITQDLPNYDYIHCIGWSLITVAVAIAARMKRVKLICEVARHQQASGSGASGQLMRLTYRLADLIICLSKETAERIAPESRSKVWVRRNPVDCAIFHIGESAPPFVHGRTMLAVGAICDRKNQLFLCEVLALMSRNWSLIVIGPAEGQNAAYLQTLRRKVVQSGLTDRVTIVPRQLPAAEVASHMRRATALVLASKDEGMPNVVLEALCCGLPVVVSPFPDSAEVVREGYGWISQLEAASFASCLGRLETVARGGDALLGRREIAAEAEQQYDTVSSDRSSIARIHRLLEVAG